MSRKHRFQGFTLIELLVVISIIALLISILLPALGAARNSAMAVKCLTYQRQLGTAFHIYFSEAEEMVPPGYASAANGGTWHPRIYRYLESKQPGAAFNYNYVRIQRNLVSPTESTFLCPTTLRDGFKLAPTWVGPMNAAASYTYGINITPAHTLFGKPLHANAGGAGRFSYRVSEIPSASSTVLLMETALYFGWAAEYFDFNGLVPHQGAANFLYFDGHAAAVRFDDVPEDTNDLFWDATN